MDGFVNSENVLSIRFFLAYNLTVVRSRALNFLSAIKKIFSLVFLKEQGTTWTWGCGQK
jgi:hypothetical protein